MVLGFAEWLRQVDPTGSLDGYLMVLEETCDEDEIESRYFTTENGKKTLDPSFFDDMGIANPQHQLLFCKAVSGGLSFRPQPRGNAEQSSSEQNLAGMMGAVHANAEAVSANIHAEEELAARPAHSRIAGAALDFPSWLRQVDPTGGLDVYLQGFEENYEVEDMERLWAASCFFEELMITQPKHQQLFASYFQRSGSEP
eukprot:gb/GFBE01015456.1/.p1 GENE.gb/GFBE01015456.1/~~gb/GFBE01015456.1/.p1  ORF type:complete len:199 (+),score=42.90 gb/GFBE01015456.1/:1-597(+)